MVRLNLNARQRRTLTACCAAYMIAYIGRMNYSAAIPNMLTALSITEIQAGFIQTVHAVVYAAAQLICGTIANRLNSKNLIVAGLLLSAAFNAIFSIADSYALMVTVWGCNAFAQAMLFTPIMRVIASTFDSSKRKTVSLIFSVCIVTGHLLSWAISGVFASILGWRMSFAVPAVILLSAAILVLAILKGNAEEEKTDGTNAARPGVSFMRLLFQVRLIYIFVSCVAAGFALEGILNWAPTMIAELTNVKGGLSGALLSLIIPCIKLLGLFICQFIAVHIKSDFCKTTAVLLAGGAVMALISFILIGYSAALFTFSIGFMCAFTYAATNVQSVRLPVQYAKTGRVPQIAGIADSLIHLGYAVSDTATGASIDAYGSGITVLILGIASLAAAPLMLIGARVKNKEEYMD